MLVQRLNGLFIDKVSLRLSGGTSFLGDRVQCLCWEHLRWSIDQVHRNDRRTIELVQVQAENIVEFISLYLVLLGAC